MALFSLYPKYSTWKSAAKIDTKVQSLINLKVKQPEETLKFTQQNIN